MTMFVGVLFFFFTQKTSYDMRISDWSSDVCSSDLHTGAIGRYAPRGAFGWRSEIPEGSDPAEGVAIGGDAAHRREGQMRRDEILTARGRLLQQANAHAHRFFGIMLEAVMPVGMVETDGEERVAREGQALATRCDMDDAVPRRVPAGQLCDHARRHFALLVEGHDLVGIGIDELRSGRSEEHTSELQSLMRISYAVFCLKKKKKKHKKFK